MVNILIKKIYLRSSLCQTDQPPQQGFPCRRDLDLIGYSETLDVRGWDAGADKESAGSILGPIVANQRLQGPITLNDRINNHWMGEQKAIIAEEREMRDGN